MDDASMHGETWTQMEKQVQMDLVVCMRVEAQRVMVVLKET